MSDNETPLTKPKKQMTQKQLDNLKIGRENNLNKKKERLIEAAKFLIENNISLTSVQKNRKTREKFLSKQQEESDSESEEEVIIKKTKPKKESDEKKKNKKLFPTTKEKEKEIIVKADKKPKTKIEIELSESDSDDDSESETIFKEIIKTKKPFKSQENTKSKIKITKQPFVGGFI